MSDPPPRRRRFSWAALGTAAAVAVSGSFLVALAECLLAAAAVARHLHGDALPRALLVAALGKAALSHTPLWLVVLILCALICAALRPARRTARPAWGPLFAGLFVALAGAVVVPADLALAGRASVAGVAAGLGGVILAAAATYALLRRAASRRPARPGRRWLAGLALACGLATLGAAAVFARSPWFDAAGFRVPPPPQPLAPSGRPNLLWIVLDTLRADRTSVYSERFDTTPRLKRFAAGALVFERAVANGVWTVPAHASMFTGLSVRAHGVDHRHLWLTDQFPTVASVLRERGYATGLFSNNPFVSRDTNLARGFDTCHVVYHLRHLGRFSLEYLWECAGLPPLVPWFDGDFGAGLTNQLVARWLDSRRGPPRPLFVLVNYMEAHLPYRVPARYRALYLNRPQVARSYRLRRRAYGNIVSALDYRFNIEGPRFLRPADRVVLRRQYLAALRYLDRRVAELLRVFAQRGLLENTLVVVSSDHGEYLGTHEMWSHRFLAYDDLVRVMLLLREPGRRAGKRVSTPAQLSDLYGTLLGALLDRKPQTPGYHSADLFALAEGQDQQRIAVAEYYGPSDQTLARIARSGRPAALHRAQPQLAAVGTRYKYLRSADGTRELYDLWNDPGELDNLIARLPDRVAPLAAHIRQWRRQVQPRRPLRARRLSDLPPDVERALRSLGYAGDD